MAEDESLKPIAVVLSMHRSGSSVLTRGLQVLNLDLGDNLMSPVPNNNETGFWEDLDLNAVNEKIFAKIDSSWDRIGINDTFDFESDAFFELRQQAAEILRNKTRGEQIFGFKDPRTAVLMPFWKCVFGDVGLDPRYIITVRSPIEVALSLQKRDGFPLSKGLLLWAKHVIIALQQTHGERRVFVAFNCLLDDPERELERISQTLELPSPEPDALEVYRGEFIRHSLRHNSVSHRETERSRLVPDFVKELMALLSELAILPPSETITVPAERLEELVKGFEAAAPYFGIADDLDRSVTAERLRAETAEAKLKQMESGITKLEKSLSDETVRLKSAESELQKSQIVVKSREGEVEEVRKALASAREQAQQAEARSKEAEVQKARLSDQIAAFTHKIKEQRHELTAQKNEAARVLEELNELKRNNADEIGILTDSKLKVEAELAEARRSLADVNSELARHRSESDSLQKKLDSADAEKADPVRKASELNAKVDQLTSGLLDEQQKVSRLSHQLRSLEEERKALGQAQSRMKAELLDKKINLRLANAERYALRQSLWWRLGGPWRLIGRLARWPVRRRSSAPANSAPARQYSSENSKKKLGTAIS